MRFTLRHGVVGVLVFAGVVGATALLFKLIPGGFVPAEDQGRLISALSLPTAPRSNAPKPRASVCARWWPKTRRWNTPLLSQVLI